MDDEVVIGAADTPRPLMIPKKSRGEKDFMMLNDRSILIHGKWKSYYSPQISSKILTSQKISGLKSEE